MDLTYVCLDPELFSQLELGFVCLINVLGSEGEK